MKVYSILLFCAAILLLMPGRHVFAQEELQLMSESAVLMDAKSGQILYGKNETERMNPASITKIATAIYAIEHSNLDEQVTVSEQATMVEGTRVYLEAGEVVSMEKLLTGMLMNSGNDAAVAIAEHIDGSVAQFSKNINKYLTNKIGVTNTHFENPNGLYNENHYTTAADMAKITKYALANDTFRKIFGMKEYHWDGQSWDTTLLTHHRLLKGEFPYETATVTGGKNGFINESGFTLVTTAEKDNLELIAVTMKTNFKDAPYSDTIQLLDYGFKNFTSEMIPKETIFTEDGMKYMVEEDFYFTTKNGQDYKQTVDSHGVLHIEDNDTDQLTVSVPLHPLNAPEPAKKDDQGIFAPVMDHFLHYLSAVLIPTTGIAYLFHF